MIGFLGRNQSGQVESFFSPAVDTLPTGYLDKSGIITHPGDDTRLVKYESEELIRKDLASGKISGYIVIPEDFIVNGSLDYVKMDFNPLSAFEQAGKFQDLLTKNLLVDDPETAERYINPLNVELINKNPDPKQAQESAASLLIPTAITVLFYIILVSSATLLLHSITKEKENRVMEMLISSVTARQILTGKIIALGICRFVTNGSMVGFRHVADGNRETDEYVARCDKHSNILFGLVTDIFSGRVSALCKPDGRSWRNGSEPT